MKLRYTPQLRWLSACYFFYYAILGLMMPYLGTFFQSRGFNAQEIGVLLAVVMATRIIAPNVWARVADYFGLRVELIKFGAGAAAISYISFFFEGGFFFIVGSLVLYTFFWNAILAQLEVVTLDSLGKRASAYGAIRSWGSVGFICLVVAAGFAIEKIGVDILPYLGMVLFSAMFLCSLSLKTPFTGKQLSTPVEQQGILTTPVIYFLISAMLLQMSLGPFYGFFVLYLTQAGYSESAAGMLMAFGVIAEILMFMFVPRLLKHYSVIALLMFGMGLTVLRWLIMAVGVDSLALLIFSQTLHAFTFGLVHAASIQFIYRHFNKAHQSQGQALYASIGFGLGGAIGVWIAGQIWGNGTGSQWMWVFAAVCALCAMIVLSFVHRPIRKHQTNVLDRV